MSAPPTTNERRFILPIGPQHPALKEPEHFEFTLEGEMVVDAKVRLGYAHRGIEKATEGHNWTQNLYLLERICGICSHSHAMAFSIGVERLAGVTAPPRANAIRVLVAELERMHSHILWLGVAAHEAGFDTLFMYSWRDREAVMRLLEQISGNRVNYSVNALGGVKRDLTPEMRDEARNVVRELDSRIRHYLDVITTDKALSQRIRGIGVMTTEQALSLSVTGPLARASGVGRDVRLDAPYAGYATYRPTLITETRGDLQARFVVRLNELLESCRLVHQIADELPEGDLQTRMPRKIKAGETISRIEAPRGELFYFIKSNGGDTPERIHVRTPTIPNLASVLMTAVGNHLADMPMILAGIDPCFSCNDRSIRIGDSKWTWKQFRQFGIDYYRQKSEL